MACMQSPHRAHAASSLNNITYERKQKTFPLREDRKRAVALHSRAARQTLGPTPRRQQEVEYH